MGAVENEFGICEDARYPGISRNSPDKPEDFIAAKEHRDAKGLAGVIGCYCMSLPDTGCYKSGSTSRKGREGGKGAAET